MYSLNKVRPHVWHIKMDCLYELGMTFLRASEYYESVNEDFRGKLGWTLLDHMKWYATTSGIRRRGEYGSFSFCVDWGGYNVPGFALDELYPRRPGYEADEIVDWNCYDARIHGFLQDIRKEEANARYYVIGTETVSEKGAFGHELAHAYYYTDDSYRREMDRIMNTTANEWAVQRLRSDVRLLGYCEEVLHDEVQAYCSTGFPGAFQARILDKRVKRLVTEIGQVFAHWENRYNG